MTRFTIEFSVNDELDIAIMQDTLVHLLATTQPCHMSVIVRVDLSTQDCSHEPHDDNHGDNDPPSAVDVATQIPEEDTSPDSTPDLQIAAGDITSSSA